MIKIYTIIVTYNAMRRDWITRCLESLAKSTVQMTAVVVDNGSTDGTREYVPAQYPQAVWLPQERNLGFGQANNLGIRYALEHDADYVLLLNQDATLAPDAIERMLAASDGKSLLSPLHLNGDGTALDFMFHSTIRTTRQSPLLDDLLLRLPLKPSYETGEICAACWFMPAALIRKIGGFNPLFFHYSEDNNYFHRMVYHGVNTLVVPSATMCHDRKVWGNAKAFHHQLVYRDLLLEACNINHSFLRCCTGFLRILARCYVYDLRRQQYKPGSYTIGLLRCLGKARVIARSRKAEKREGANWL